MRNWLVLAFALATVAGCNDRSDSLVVVDVGVAGNATLAGVTRLSVVATAGGRSVPFTVSPTNGAATLSIPPAQSFGIALPHAITGAIHVHVNAIGAGATTLASGDGDGTIKLAAVSTMTLALQLPQAVAMDMGAPDLPPPSPPDLSPPPPDLLRAPAQLSVDHPSRSVGEVIVNQPSSAARFVITNVGDSASDPLTFTPGGNTVEFKLTSDCAAALMPHTSCNVTAVLTPNGPGDKSATFTVADGLGASASGTVTGTALTGGSLSITPDANGDCGSSLIGVVSTTVATFTVKNKGQSNTGLPMVSTSDDQFMASGCASALAPNQTCTVSVSFKPKTNGTQTASVKVQAMPGGPATSGLTGVGLRPATLSAPATVSFPGTTPRGSTSGAQLVTVRNDGDVASATLSPSTLLGSGFAITPGGDGCGGTSVGGQKSCTVSIAFSPTATGPASATLDINSGSTVVASSMLSGTASAAWSQEATSLTLNQLNSVWGLDADHVYAVGLAGTIAARDNTGTWSLQTPVAFMHAPDHNAIWGSGPNDLYIAATDHGLFHSLGNGIWAQASGSNLPTATTFTGIWGFSDRIIYGTVGSHFYYPGSGNSWLSDTAGGNGQDRVWGTSGTDLYMFGAGDGMVRIYYYTTGGWTKPFENTAAFGTTVTSVWGFGSPANVVYATLASAGPLRSNGGGAAFLSMTGQPPQNCSAVWGANTSAVLFACQGGIYTWNGSSWAGPTLTSINTRALWGPSASSIYAVGTDNNGSGVIYHYY